MNELGWNISPPPVQLASPALRYFIISSSLPSCSRGAFCSKSLVLLCWWHRNTAFLTNVLDSSKVKHASWNSHTCSIIEIFVLVKGFVLMVPVRKYIWFSLSFTSWVSRFAIFTPFQICRQCHSADMCTHYPLPTFILKYISYFCIIPWLKQNIWVYIIIVSIPCSQKPNSFLYEILTQASRQCTIRIHYASYVQRY